MELPSLLQLEESAEAETELGESAEEEAEDFAADDGEEADDGEDEESAAQEEVGEEDGEALADSSDELLGPNKTDQDKVMAQAQKDLAAMDKAIKAGDVSAVDKISAQTEKAVENAVKVEQARESSGKTSTAAAASTAAATSTAASTTAATSTAASTKASTATASATSTKATTTTSSSSAAGSRDVQPVLQATGAGPFEAAAGMRGAIDASVKGLAEVAEKAKSRAKDALGKLGEYQQTVQNLRPPLRTMSQQASELQDTFVKAWKADEVTRVAPFDSLDFGTAE